MKRYTVELFMNPLETATAIDAPDARTAARIFALAASPGGMFEEYRIARGHRINVVEEPAVGTSAGVARYDHSEMVGFEAGEILDELNRSLEAEQADGPTI